GEAEGKVALRTRRTGGDGLDRRRGHRGPTVLQGRIDLELGLFPLECRLLIDQRRALGLQAGLLPRRGGGQLSVEGGDLGVEAADLGLDLRRRRQEGSDL